MSWGDAFQEEATYVQTNRKEIMRYTVISNIKPKQYGQGRTYDSAVVFSMGIFNLAEWELVTEPSTMVQDSSQTGTKQQAIPDSGSA